MFFGKEINAKRENSVLMVFAQTVFFRDGKVEALFIYKKGSTCAVPKQRPSTADRHWTLK
jgi:hypothetical protein